MIFKADIFRKHMVIVCGGLTLSLLLSALLPQHDYDNIFAHSAIEATSALTAIITAIILLQRQTIDEQPELRWMICGLFIMGIMDSAHAISVPGNDFVLFHSLAVFWGGLFFAFSWLPYWHPAFAQWPRLVVIMGVTIGTTLCFLIAVPADVSAMLVNNEFTVIAKSFHLLGGLTFFTGAFYFFLMFSRTRDRRFIWIALFSYLMGFGGVDFLYGEMWTDSWWLWHTIQLIAFVILMTMSLITHHQSIRGLQRALVKVEQGRNALRASEEKHRTMLEAMMDPVYLCSPDFKIDYMNPAMIHRIGRDATGESCHLALHNTDQRCDWCEFENITEVENRDVSIVSPLDNRAFQITSIPVLNPDGTISKMAFYRDTTDYLDAVSERNEVQLQLRQAQKLEAVGTLAGGIAHDFNNILFPIIGLTEMLLERETDIRSKEDLQEILTAGKRAQTLVSQILAFSRERQGSLEPLNPAPIVKEVLKLARSTLPANINIIQQISPDPGVVMADAVQLHQVVMNIISNAFHAMEISGGTLTVFLDKVSFTDMYDSPSGRNDNWLCLSITDTGDGIDPEIMDRIFDPYFTTKPQNKGTGLGLAVTHGIIKSFGGEIEVSSTPGEGSCFSISLPLTKGEGEDQYDREPDRATLRLTADGETLLVVDDEAPIIRVLDAQLTNAGYRVETFTSSPDALFAFTSSPDRYDLIISDFTMPEMTGDLLSKRVRQIRPEIPFLLMSGKNAADRLSDQLPEGIRAVLTKPVDKQTLLTTIKENLP